MPPESGFRMAGNWPQIRKKMTTPQFAYMTSSSNIFDIDVFLLSSLVTDQSFMSLP